MCGYAIVTRSQATENLTSRPNKAIGVSETPHRETSFETPLHSLFITYSPTKKTEKAVIVEATTIFYIIFYFSLTLYSNAKMVLVQRKKELDTNHIQPQDRLEKEVVVEIKNSKVSLKSLPLHI